MYLGLTPRLLVRLSTAHPSSPVSLHDTAQLMAVPLKVQVLASQAVWKLGGRLADLAARHAHHGVSFTVRRLCVRTVRRLCVRTVNEPQLGLCGRLGQASLTSCLCICLCLQQA